MLGRSEDPGEDAQAVWNQTLSSEATAPTHVWMSLIFFSRDINPCGSRIDRILRHIPTGWNPQFLLPGLQN
jgi:hypothetical protein